MLIHDLDNPFGYYEKGSSEDISLRPLDNFIQDIDSKLTELEKSSS